MPDNQMTREQRRKAQMRQQKNANKKNPKEKGKKASAGTWIKRIVLAVVLLGFAGLLFGAGLFAVYASSAPELDEELLRDPISPTFLAADGETEIPYFTAQDRLYVEYEDIPKAMEDAILATEDNRFYEHSGIDIIRLGGAVIANVTDGFGSQGASTITQQVIKNSFLKNEKTLKRKAQEAYLAYQLEKEYTKEEIFEMYFNKILMSGNIYGFGTAAENFYGKTLEELELHQMALLAGMPQSPNRYNPFNNPEAAEQRRNIVLSLMEQHGRITTEQKEQAQAQSVTDSLLPEEERKKQPSGEYTAFMEMVVQELETLEGEYALDEGLTIHTTLEPNVQKVVNETMASDLFFNEEVESGLTVVDTKTGAIRAVGAARDYSGDVRRNYATESDRHIGSTIKPLVAFGPGIEYEGWSTGQTVVDEPYQYEDGQEVRNVDGAYQGPLTIREALYRSRNIPAVKALGEVGYENAKEFTQKLGLDFGELYESSALGSHSVSTVELAGAFAAFGNEGIYTKPHTITKIVYRDGVTEETVKPDSVPAMKDSTAYMVTDMLRDVVDTTLAGSSGKEAAISGLDLAGKTGTTNYTAEELQDYGLSSSNAPDIWFAGYTSNYSISVWSGYPTKAQGIDTSTNERLLAQRLFKNVMSQISPPSETANFEKPESVVEAEVQLYTDPLRLASASTPANLRRTELFARGTEPAQQAAPVEEEEEEEELAAPTGLSADVTGESAALTWNYDSDEDVSFEVAVSANGASSVVGTTSDRSFTYDGLEQGVSYTFSVTAVSGELRSAPASVIVEIAAQEEPEEEPEEPVEQPEEPEEVPDEEETDPNAPGSGNGGNNGDGQGEGNNNGGGQGEGSGNNNGGGQGNGNNNGGGGQGGGGGQDGGNTPPDDGDEGDVSPSSNPGNNQGTPSDDSEGDVSPSSVRNNEDEDNDEE